MTSMSSESVQTILCTSKQTRFHIESPNYRELDIEGVNIAITSASPNPGEDGDKSSSSGKGKVVAKGKGKSKAEGIEILSNAKLRLKEGQRYALVGRNGTGKSSMILSWLPQTNVRTLVTICRS
jgi:ABC-type multidrug transport system fused ATPase/permease subunit